MTKTRLLIIGLFITAVFLLILYFLGINKKQSVQLPIIPTPTPVTPLFPVNQASPTAGVVPTGETTIIDNITTNNFYQTSPFDSEGDRALVDTDSYRIVYLPGSKQFLITIIGHGFDQNRQAAEQALLDALGISQSAACQLNVTVQTTSSANPDQAGQSYGLSFCQSLSQPSQPPQPTYATLTGLNIAVGNPPDGTDVGLPAGSGSVAGLIDAVSQILTCEGGGAHAPYPACVRSLSIPQQFKNNLNATYPSFQCGQFIWSAQGLLGWPRFPGNVGSVFQWYTMNPGHAQSGYSFVCNPYRISSCQTSKTNQAAGAIAPGDIILYGSTSRSDPGHIAIVVSTQSNLFTIRVTEANYRHGITWFRWTNLLDNLGRGADILGWWRKK